MPARVTVTVEGAGRYRRTLRQAGQRADLAAAHGEVADLVTRRAVVPTRTGRLAAGTRGRGLKRSAVVRTSVVYGAPIHYGWPERGIPAQPFAVESAESNEPAWKSIYQRELDRIVNTIKGA